MICPHCGKEFSDDLETDFCPSCGGRLDEGASPFEEDIGTEYGFPGTEEEEIPLFTAEPSEPGWEEAYQCPWEDREERGMIAAWWETTKGVLFKPSDFYRQLQPTGRLGDALLFAGIWIVIGAVVQTVYQVFFQGIQFSLMQMFGAEEFAGGADPFGIFGAGTMMGVQAVSGLVCGPIIGFVVLIIYAGIIHLCLRLVGGVTQPFEASLRTFCYVQSITIFNLIPICGGLIGLVWAIVVSIIGLNEVHRCGGGKAAAAVFMPVVLCALCICGSVGMVIGMAEM